MCDGEEVVVEFIEIEGLDIMYLLLFFGFVWFFFEVDISFDEFYLYLLEESGECLVEVICIIVFG